MAPRRKNSKSPAPMPMTTRLLRDLVALLGRAFIVGFIQQKGGVGKTTAALNLAIEAALLGMRVLLVDGDPQRTATGFFHVSQRSECGPVPGLDVVVMGAEMAERLPELAKSYDLVVIDTAGIVLKLKEGGSPVRAALMVADVVALPCGPGDEDAWSLFGQQLGTEAVESRAPTAAELVIDAMTQRAAPAAGQTQAPLRACVFLTQRPPRFPLARLRTFLGKAGFPVLRSELRYNAVYLHQKRYGVPLAVLAPDDGLDGEVRQLLRELVRFQRSPIPTSAPAEAQERAA